MRMPLSALPVYQALREVHEKKPLQLWGPRLHAKQPRKLGRKLGTFRKVLALLDRQKNLAGETRETPGPGQAAVSAAAGRAGVKQARPELGLPIVKVKRAAEVNE